MRFSQSGRRELIKWEGMYGRVYDDLKGEKEKRKGMVDCYSAQGTPTIGVGHVVYASWVNECDKYSNHFRSGYDMTESEMLALMEQDIAIKEPYLNRLLKTKVSQKQYDALFLMMYNTGSGNKSFRKVIDFVNKRDWKGAEDAIRGGTATAIGSDGVLTGLQRRRKAEADLFKEGSKSRIDTKILLASILTSLAIVI